MSVQEDKAGIADDAVSAVIPKAVIYMPFAELVDIEKEIEGKHCTFSAFVIEAARVAVDNLKEKNKSTDL